MSFDRMTTDHTHDTQTACLATDEPTGACARELAGLAPLTPQQIAELNLRARYGGEVPAWRRALDSAIAAHPRRLAGVAEALGVSRPYVSRVVNFHMPTAPQPFVERVIAIYMRVECPHLCKSIAPDECRTYQARDYSALSQFEVTHWRACQRCTVKAPPAPPRPQGDLL